MKKILAGLALSAAMLTGGVASVAPAEASGIYVSVGDHHHWHHDREWRRHHWRGWYWHNRYWHDRYRCWRWDHHYRWRGWCYR